MDLDQPIEPLRERAVTSEPASSRPKPFDEDGYDDNQSSSRKRQRRESDSPPTNMPVADSSPAVNGVELAEPTLPATPTRIVNRSASTLNSNRITLNLRNIRQSGSSSSTLQSPSSPSKAAVANDSDPAVMNTSIDRSNESEVDANHVHPTIETPSSSLSSGEPEVMLVEDEPEYDFSPAVAIIDNEAISDDEMGDQTYSFPFLDEETSLTRAAMKLAHHFECGTMQNDSVFTKLHLWIERYTSYAHQKPDEAFESFCSNKEFWDAIFEVIKSLSIRKPHFGNWLKTDSRARKSLSCLFWSFGSLAACFVCMDIRTLTRSKENPDANTVLASRPFLEALNFLFNRIDAEHIGHYLNVHYSWDWESEMLHMHGTLERNGADMQAFVQLARMYLELVPQTPEMMVYLREPCQFVCQFLRYSKIEARAATSFHSQEHLRRCHSAYVDVFKPVEAHLTTFIEKQGTFFSVESLLTQITALTEILEIVLEVKDGPAESLLLETSRTDPCNLPAACLMKAAAYRWKFAMLNKMIISSQMQLRVAGISMFCSELLRAYKNQQHHNSPLLRNYADFIVKAELVDYIVGVASHPEIITVASDMVGFLAATKTYTNDHADKIWHTINSSLDPRVVESVLNSQKSLLHLLDHPEQLYLCTKLQEIPVEAFTFVMREFCEALFTHIRKGAQDRKLEVEAPPYDVCVRLIRESTLPRSASSTEQNTIQQWASQQLDSLARREDYNSGPTLTVRLQIYQHCIDDLRDISSKTADGSLIVIGTLVESNMTDLRQLVTGQTDFIPLVIENFSWRKSSYGVTKHIRLFQHIIEKNFMKDYSGFGLHLWNKIIGAEEAVSEGEERQQGWKMLTRVTKNAKIENAFVKACVHNYLPSLPPRLFSKASFAFARGAIGFRSTREFVDLDDGGSSIDSNGVEQLWRMVFEGHDNLEFQRHAITELISFYLESSIVTSLSPEKLLEVHVAFVDRCLAQLMVAAKKLRSFSEGTTCVDDGDDEPMVIVAPDAEVHEQGLIFSRSLSLLKTFLRNYQSNPLHSRRKMQHQNQSICPPEPIKGDTLNVSYQVFDGHSDPPKQTLAIGKLNSGASLLGSLQKASGFKHMKIFHLGQDVTAARIDLSKSLEELRLGTHLMIVSRAAEPRPSSVQMEVMKRCDGLFELLAMDSAQAKEIYDFLIWFPPYDKLLDALLSEDMSCEDMFPVMYPYKSLYAMHSLHLFVVDQSKTDAADQRSKLRCFTLLIDNLVSHEVYSYRYSDQKSTFFIKLIDSLGILSAEPFFAEFAANNSKLLLNRLMVLITDTQESSSEIANVLLFKVFWFILSTSVEYPCLWAEFKVHPNTKQLVQSLLLCKAVRASDIVDPKSAIEHACSKHPSPTGVAQIEVLQFFWPLSVELVSKAISHADRCEEVLSLVQEVLKAAVEVSESKEVSIDRLDLRALSVEWAQLLVSREVIQYVGRPATIDHVACGLASLLLACVKYMDSLALEPLRPMAEALFRKHLFPNLPTFFEPGLESPNDASLPLLDTTTRQLIVEIILALVHEDEQSYMSLLRLATALVVPSAESSDGTYQFELCQSFDRSLVTRSATGYVGLKNLSNTCYLNSLMTQLFMNLSFREFMLTAHVAEGSSQKLLQQTQKLFAEMQNSVMRCADPQELTQSIRTYDDTHIDVTVQMDVDEFYNLLFDRWESQILAADAKTAFRSFYGGQLVQQVKSKECDHLSERLEPFSAIQCDIKGKTSLIESLKAYVKGEIMEGDNKYKCSTCDRHVDAVKRACLKDVPDNLIFHLKRFDYDLRANRRNKLNDYFAFPTDIDMRPYKVGYLTEGPECLEEDIFELVGVLVHSGTAESGHYYSYIRERPSTEDNSWVEFNDDHVTPFDSSNIEASCFGGQDFQNSANYPYDKAFSAYMLFYQRRSFLNEQKQRLSPLLGIEPVKLPVPLNEAALIRQQNLLNMRKYVMYDPSHAFFIRELLLQLPSAGYGKDCSPTHELEHEALSMTLNHMDQVFGRTKQTPDFHYFLEILGKMFGHCAACSKHFLRWIVDSQDACRQLLIKSPDDIVRNGTANLIIVALKTLKDRAPHDYGLIGYLETTITDRGVGYRDSDDAVHDLNGENGIFGLVVEAISQQWDNALVMLRAWPQYFTLVAELMAGSHEAALLMDNGLLEKTIHIIGANSHPEPTPEITRMLNVFHRRYAGKPISYDPVLCLMAKFLEFAETIGNPQSSQEPFRTHQLLLNSPLMLWKGEHRQLSMHWDSGHDNAFFSDLLRLSMIEPATQSILEQILLKMPTADSVWKNSIYISISEMVVKVATSNWYAVPHLRSALTFCQYIDDVDFFKAMVFAVRDAVAKSEVHNGIYFLQFFKELMDLPDTRIKWSKLDLAHFCIAQIEFWGPSLLLNYEDNVRSGTEEYIKQTVLKHATGTDNENSILAQCCTAVAQNLGQKCLVYLYKHYVRPNLQILNSHIFCIKDTIDACGACFEEGSAMQAEYLSQFNRVWPGVMRLGTDQIEDEGSNGSDEWASGDDLSTSSLVVDDRDPVSLVDNINDL